MKSVNMRVPRGTADFENRFCIPVCRPVKHLCFTLIELLVVIAIIAILAAMLMPALNKARERGKGIQCLSNIKQTNAGLSGYQNDYKGFIPPNWAHAKDILGVTGVYQVGSYKADGNNPLHYNIFLYALKYVSNVRALNCASENSQNLFITTKIIESNNYYLCLALTTGFGMVNHGGSGSNWAQPIENPKRSFKDMGYVIPSPGGACFFKFEKEKSPGRRILLTDSIVNSTRKGSVRFIHYYYMNYWSGYLPSATKMRGHIVELNTTAVPAERHGMYQTNAAFLDGHAEPASRRKLYDGSLLGGRDYKMMPYATYE